MPQNTNSKGADYALDREHAAVVLAVWVVCFAERLPRNLREALAVSGRTFERLRYMYERDDHRSYISFLPIALKKALLVLHPDWQHL